MISMFVFLCLKSCIHGFAICKAKVALASDAELSLCSYIVIKNVTCVSQEDSSFLFTEVKGKE